METCDSEVPLRHEIQETHRFTVRIRGGRRPELAGEIVTGGGKSSAAVVPVPVLGRGLSGTSDEGRRFERRIFYRSAKLQQSGLIMDAWEILDAWEPIL